LTGECSEVGLVFDLLTHIPASVVPGDFYVAVEDPNDGVGGDERQRLPDERVRDGVVIAVEANVRRLARGHGLRMERVEAMLGERQEPLSLLDERLRDGTRVVSGNSSCVHDALEPCVELLIEVGEARARSSSEE